MSRPADSENLGKRSRTRSRDGSLSESEICLIYRDQTKSIPPHTQLLKACNQVALTLGDSVKAQDEPWISVSLKVGNLGSGPGYLDIAG